MKIKFIVTMGAIIFIASCSGLLWDGPSAGGSNLTISIDNPFYQGSAPIEEQTVRALALQGNYLYIELARIDDQAGYDADAEKQITGNGTWVDTAWGGHGIMTFDLSNWVETLEATFQGVPRGQDIRGRVYLDYSESNLISGLSGNYLNEALPMCHTFNPSGTDNIEKSWITVLSDDLNDGNISLPIRPEFITSHNNSLFILELFSDQVPEPYVDQLEQTLETEPAIGETKFRRFEIDIDSNFAYLKDLAFYMMVEVDLQTVVSLPGIAALYDVNGSLVADRGGDTFSLTPAFPHRYFYIAYPELDANYYNDDLFIGSTLFPGLALEDNVNYSYGLDTYNVGFGILYDGDMQVSSGVVTWNVPQGFLSSDFEFKVIETDEINLNETNVETVSQINALYPHETDTGWVTGVLSYDSSGTIENGSGKWIIILAKTSFGKEFVFARVFQTQG